MKRKSQKSAFLVTAHVRQLGEKAAPVFFILMALFLLLATSLNGRLAEKMRIATADISAPIMNAISSPVQDTLMSVGAISNFVNITEQNAALRAENERLKKWYQLALSLKMENESLSGLLNLVNEPNRSFITTRVITDPTGPFYRTVLIPAGADTL